jgi:hypothetical protein
MEQSLQSLSDFDAYLLAEGTFDRHVRDGRRFPVFFLQRLTSAPYSFLWLDWR